MLSLDAIRYFVCDYNHTRSAAVLGEHYHSERLVMTRSLLFATLLVLCLPLVVRAEEVSVSPPPHLSAKLIGVTVLVGCPDERLRQVFRHKGEGLGADYTVFPQVAAAAWCPVTESSGPLAPRPTVGPLWSFSQPTLDYAGTGAAFGTWETLGAVTVGLHYRVVQ
jgi:hypothetical protein